MKGPLLTVYGNAQDGVGNTMDEGRIVIHGDAGDIVGHSMRGGKIFIRGDAGYRVGIHMKEYGEKKPTLVVGVTAQDFLGEYLGLDAEMLLLEFLFPEHNHILSLCNQCRQYLWNHTAHQESKHSNHTHPLSA